MASCYLLQAAGRQLVLLRQEPPLASSAVVGLPSPWSFAQRQALVAIPHRLDSDQRSLASTSL